MDCDDWRARIHVVDSPNETKAFDDDDMCFKQWTHYPRHPKRCSCFLNP